MSAARGRFAAALARVQGGLLAALLLWLPLSALPARAESEPPIAAAAAKPASEAAAGAAQPEATVVLFNRPIAVLRVPFLGAAPADRARRTEAVLNAVIDTGGPGEVKVQPHGQGNVLLIDGRLTMFLLPGDADAMRGESLEEATQAAVAALRGAIAATQESRDQGRLLKSLAHAGLATLAFLLACVVTWRAREWLSGRLSALLQKRMETLQVAGGHLLPRDKLVVIARWLVRLLSWLVLALLCYQWLSFLLGQFPYSRPWGETLNQYLIGVVSRIGNGVLHALPDLLVAIIIVGLARLVIDLAAPFFERLESGRGTLGGLDADTARPTRRLFNIGVWLFAIVMAYPYLPGSQSDAFRGLSLLIGLMISVGGSSLFGQAAAGLILMYSRTLRVGEYVRIDDHEGTVTEMRAFTAKIRTGLGEELTLPNSLVLGTVTKNYSRSVQGRGYIVDTTVTIGYDTPWRQVHAMLIEAALRTPGVLAEPRPRVFQTALADFYPEYRLVCQAVPSEPRPRAEVLANLHANIQDVFNEHGVQIMSPHYLDDPAQAKIVPRSAWFTAPATRDTGPV
ncbi:mechanosensitive ion channel family protein [Roseateles violae]|uniref:Small-conductance mechanosensitive channel n=1 Tax=Roseateles violae TaxID=3058042 RepID=A0ABT8DXN1_9BURK|nr:mechanosensitive ion channel family protein [Pelomonas sp. PFR6]MDN3922318.1 mechanosensitive ion channel family protein [Pelomonas sp. PFR6]